MNPVTTPENNPDRTSARIRCSELQKYGQSVWLDYIRRNLITSGELQTLDR